MMPRHRPGSRFFRGCLIGIGAGLFLWILLFLGAAYIGSNLIGHLRR